MRHPFLRTLAGASAVATDPNFENVTLLLHGDGTNGGQNNTFVDGSTNNFTITRNGNTTQGTFSPYGDNWSNYFDGTGDYLTAPAGSSFAYGTGDFTVEGWFYATAEPVQYGSTLFSQTASGNNYFYLALGDDTANNPPARKIKFTFASTNVLSGSTTYNLHSWNHFALVRSSGSATVYLNGVGGTAVACTTDFNNTTFVPTIGRYTHTNANLYTGYLSNFRVLKGTAQYTANFTPPSAPLTAITNTSLLTCQSNRFRDASTNNFTITRNGDVSVQRFSPFSPTAAYAAGTIGGSGYFDGTGDYLSYGTGNVLLGSNDFTAEAFVYLRATNGSSPSAVFYGQGDGSTAAGSSYAFYLRSATNSELYVGSTAYGVASPVTALDQWQHVAWVRTGGTYSVFTNGSRTATRSDLGTLSVNTGSTSRKPCIGCSDDNGNFPFAGYIAGARILVGSGGYDATATTIAVPTAPLTAITNTSFLLNFTNAAIRDNAMMADLETVGNAQIDTTTKKYGTGSLEFDGTGDWLLVPDSPDQRLGTGNFTIECWLYLSATGTARGIVGKGTSTTGWLLSTNTSNAVVFTYGTSTITSTGTLSGTTWYHIAVVREGTGTNQTKIYIGGTNDGTGTVSTDFTQTNAAYVGANRTGGDPMNGYIDDLRITKGVARYTANFTAPTAAFPDL